MSLFKVERVNMMGMTSLPRSQEPYSSEGEYRADFAEWSDTGYDFTVIGCGYMKTGFTVIRRMYPLRIGVVV